MRAKLCDGFRHALGSKASAAGPNEAETTTTTHKMETMETVEQMKSLLYQCQKLGFKPDAIIAPKEHDVMIFL